MLEFCSVQPVTQQDRYNCGYNRGYLDAQRDRNLDKAEDPSCPHEEGHTPEYCSGYAIGYIASWNALINHGLNPSTNYTSPSVKFLKYENSTYGIKMQYPSDWRVEGASNSSIVASFYPQGNYASQVRSLGVDMEKKV